MTQTPARPRPQGIPYVIQRLPHHDGLPIPFTAAFNGDGTPNFRVLDAEKIRHCLTDRLCAVCGTELGRSTVFIGGDEAVSTRAFLDGPAHERCARTSARLCPALNGEQASAPPFDPTDAAARDRAAGVGLVIHEDVNASENRAPRRWLCWTPGYTVKATQAGGVLYVVEPYTHQEEITHERRR